MSTPLPAVVHVAGRCGLLASSFLVPLAAQTSVTPPPEPNKGVVVIIEKFGVTGSRIRRLDSETPSPVVTFTAAAIEEKGYATLGEFIQSLPYNNALGVSEFTTGSFFTGAATINPRGLGSNRMLTLVNGRRAVPYPRAFA